MQMPRAVAPPAAALGLTLLAACSPGGTAVDVPDGSIPVTVNSEGIATVMVGIGDDDPVPVQLDTGSTGLRIFADATSMQAPADSPTTRLDFGDGTELSGPVVAMTVAIGPQTTVGPVPVQLVTNANCASGSDGTACLGSTAKIRREQGISGILGLGLAPDDGLLMNPLPALGPDFTSYTINFNAVGGGISGGVLTGGVEPGDTFPLASVAVDGLAPPEGNSFWSDRVTACWGFDGSTPACVSTLFDTGTTAMVAPSDLPGAPGATGELDPGAASLGYYGSAAGSEPRWRVTAGKGPAGAILVEDGARDLVAGTPFWFGHVISYDLAKGSVTVSPR